MAVSAKNLYTLLAVIVVIGAAGMAAVAATYEPGEGGWNPDAVIVGLAVGFGVNSFVLLLLLLTLRTAVQTVQRAQEVAQRVDEKEHVLQIEGIGPTYATRLNQVGIITIPELMDAEPERVATQIGVTVQAVKDWQAMGQLMQVKGIGPQYAEMLVLAGCRTVGELARSDPAKLTAKIDAVEDARRDNPVVGVNITQNHVERWIVAAKEYLRSR